MTDLGRLAQPLRPDARAYSSTSFDRHSVDQSRSSWFANNDEGYYVRTENHGDHLEHVLLDTYGPGVVTRIWSANPGGRLRFYFDGKPVAAMQLPFQDVFSGRVAPFRYPLSFSAGRAYTSFFPIPYAKQLKVTVEPTTRMLADRLLYQIQYRQFAEGTTVTSLPDTKVDAKVWRRLTEQILQPERAVPAATSLAETGPKRVPAGTGLALVVGGGTPATVVRTEFKVAYPAGMDPTARENFVRGLNLRIVTDGVETVQVPLGAFFGSPFGDPTQTFTQTVSSDGTFVSRLPIPYRDGLTFRIQNRSGVDLQFEAKFRIGKPIARNPYRLHAMNQSEEGRGRPFRDLNVAMIQGSGNYVGTNLVVRNDSEAWWAEGDEKIYVDGASAPSFFGTSTENYFGNAWGSTQAMSTAFSAETHVSPEGSPRGWFAYSRSHFADPIPFGRGLRFDFEVWHPEDKPFRMERTAFWYGP